MIKNVTLTLSFLFITLFAFAQITREVKGLVQDTAGIVLPGTSVKLTSVTDTLSTSTLTDGTFIFPKVKVLILHYLFL
ncbi:MAG: hypothetical protein ACOH2A_02875 [Sphingobacteriaceae bacterium]